MGKEKNKFYNHFLRAFISHPWLKLIALILAVLAWFHVKGEINRFNY